MIQYSTSCLISSYIYMRHAQIAYNTLSIHPVYSIVAKLVFIVIYVGFITVIVSFIHSFTKSAKKTCKYFEIGNVIFN